MKLLHSVRYALPFLILAGLTVIASAGVRWYLLWDKCPEPDVVGYRVYELIGVKLAETPNWQTSTNWIAIGESSTNEFLIPGDYALPRTFTVTAFSAGGVESLKADPVSTTKGAPTGLRLRLEYTGSLTIQH